MILPLKKPELKQEIKQNKRSPNILWKKRPRKP